MRTCRQLANFVSPGVPGLFRVTVKWNVLFVGLARYRLPELDRMPQIRLKMSGSTRAHPFRVCSGLSIEIVATLPEKE